MYTDDFHHARNILAYVFSDNDSQHDVKNEVAESLVMPLLSTWSIKWDFLVRDDLLTPEIENDSDQILRVNEHFPPSWYEEVLKSNPIQWHHPHYQGHCQEFFYPLIAAAQLTDPGSKYAVDQHAIKVNPQFLTLLQNNNVSVDKISIISSNTVFYFNSVIKRVNQTLDDDLTEITKNIFQIDYQLYDWYNYSHSRSDLERAHWFQQKTGASYLRINHVTLTDTGKGSVVEVLFTLNNDRYKTFKRSYNPTFDGNRFLCVFNTNFVVLSTQFRRRMGFQDVFVVECDIESHSNKTLVNKMKHKILNLRQSKSLSTNIGLTLFNLERKLDTIDLLNEFLNKVLGATSTVGISGMPSTMGMLSNDI